MTTLIYGDLVSQVAKPEVEKAGLWLQAEDLKSASGWELKPEGACRDGICVPLPPGREEEFVAPASGLFNLAALVSLLDQPVAHDAAHDTWAIGEAATARHEALEALTAPDFTLPDLDGIFHSLSDYRGKKVLLVSWASW